MRQIIQAELGIDEPAVAAVVRAKVSQIWLNKDGARTIVMLPEPGKTTFTSRTATEDEIATGT